MNLTSVRPNEVSQRRNPPGGGRAQRNAGYFYSRKGWNTVGQTVQGSIYARTALQREVKRGHPKPLDWQVANRCQPHLGGAIKRPAQLSIR